MAEQIVPRIKLSWFSYIIISGSPNIPVQNLYTVDAYTSVPGGVLVNEPLPSNQYYGGRIGERREAPRGKIIPKKSKHVVS